MTGSLSARLLLAVSLVLAVFFGATVVVLDLAFRKSAERAVEDRLDVQIFLLLAEAEPLNVTNVMVPDDLPEPRFSSPGSGLYGQISDARGQLLWRSPSAVGVTLPMPDGIEVGEPIFFRSTLASDEKVFVRALAVEWEFENGGTARYQFGVAESFAPYLGQVRRFRGQLFGWFAGLAVALVVILGFLLRWVLTPLRRIEHEIEEVEAGGRAELSRSYPRELQGVTRNTNRLIRAERNRLERYRNTLGNLAHALKTPLAVIRSTLEQRGTVDKEIETQLRRVDDIMTYQLNRAAASGGMTLGHQPVPLIEVLPPLVRTLDKVYAEKSPLCTLRVPDDAIFYGDQGDLTEILGNLLDNAYKYCNGQVFLSAQPEPANDARRPGLQLVVEDDGPGISRQLVERVMQRGVRGDERAEGHGIGLAVVREIVELAGGTLTIDSSSHGGAAITVIFPAH